MPAQQLAEGISQVFLVERVGRFEEYRLIEVVPIAAIMLEKPALDSGQWNLSRSVRVLRVARALIVRPEA